MLLIFTSMAVGIRALVCGYYFFLAKVASLNQHRTSSILGGPPSHGIFILIPAHDEEITLQIALEGWLALECPQGLFEVLVVADSCMNRAATAGRRHGVEILGCRDANLIGKRFTLKWVLEQISSRSRSGGRPFSFRYRL